MDVLNFQYFISLNVIITLSIPHHLSFPLHRYIKHVHVSVVYVLDPVIRHLLWFCCPFFHIHLSFFPLHHHIHLDSISFRVDMHVDAMHLYLCLICIPIETLSRFLILKRPLNYIDLLNFQYFISLNVIITLSISHHLSFPLHHYIKHVHVSIVYIRHLL